MFYPSAKVDFSLIISDVRNGLPNLHHLLCSDEVTMYIVTSTVTAVPYDKPTKNISQIKYFGHCNYYADLALSLSLKSTNGSCIIVS